MKENTLPYLLKTKAKLKYLTARASTKITLNLTEWSDLTSLYKKTFNAFNYKVPGATITKKVHNVFPINRHSNVIKQLSKPGIHSSTSKNPWQKTIVGVQLLPKVFGLPKGNCKIRYQRPKSCLVNRAANSRVTCITRSKRLRSKEDALRITKLKERSKCLTIKGVNDNMVKEEVDEYSNTSMLCQIYKE